MYTSILFVYNVYIIVRKLYISPLPSLFSFSAVREITPTTKNVKRSMTLELNWACPKHQIKNVHELGSQLLYMLIDHPQSYV